MRHSVTFLAALLLVLPAAPLVAAADSKPNVILILVDDLGWMDLSCQGSDFYRTPNIDRLATEGMRFTDGYAACAVCSPTRAAVQTGRYPHRIGVTDWIRSRFQRGGLGTPEANPTEYVGGPKQRLLCPPNPYWMEQEEHAPATVCCPSRSALLTGVHGHKTGVYGNKNNLKNVPKAKDLVTLPKTLYDGRTSYISDRQRGAEELYDHRNDPMEWTNLAGNPEYAGMKARLKALVPRTDEPKAPENPDR